MPACAQSGIYGYIADGGTVHLSNVPDDKRYKLLLRTPSEERVETPGKTQLGTQRSDSPALAALPYHAEILAAGKTHGVDPALIHAVIKVESAHNPVAVSRKGAVGLMQLMPETARRYGVKDMRDPRQNIAGGTRYLNDLLRMFSGDLTLAIAAYNAGENVVMRHGNRIPPYAETVQYVPRVLSFYRRYTSRT